jgi:hypothetical protein
MCEKRHRDDILIHLYKKFLRAKVGCMRGGGNLLQVGGGGLRGTNPGSSCSKEPNDPTPCLHILAQTFVCYSLIVQELNLHMYRVYVYTRIWHVKSFLYVINYTTSAGRLTVVSLIVPCLLKTNTSKSEQISPRYNEAANTIFHEVFSRQGNIYKDSSINQSFQNTWTWPFWPSIPAGEKLNISDSCTWGWRG